MAVDSSGGSHPNAFTGNVPVVVPSEIQSSSDSVSKLRLTEKKSFSLTIVRLSTKLVPPAVALNVFIAAGALLPAIAYRRTVLPDEEEVEKNNLSPTASRLRTMGWASASTSIVPGAVPSDRHKASLNTRNRYEVVAVTSETSPKPSGFISTVPDGVPSVLYRKVLNPSEEAVKYR